MGTVGSARPVARRVPGAVSGIASQLLNALTNVATAYLASLLLAPAAFGEFAIGFACVTLALATGRGLIGSTMLAHLPATPPGERLPLARSALGLTAIVGLVASGLLLVASSRLPFLAWFAPWLTVALLHDTARHVLLAGGRRGRMLVLDAVWALVQATVVVLLWTAGAGLGIGDLAAAWGLGALAGLVAFAVLAPRHVRIAGPRHWISRTRDVAGWFTGVSIVGQVEIYLVLVIAGAVLGPADAGGLRAVQLLVHQPSLVLLGALLGLAVPSVARLGRDGPGLAAAWRRTAVVVTPVAVGALVVAAFAGPLMSVLFPQYTAYGPLVLPVAVQAAATALSIPTIALLVGTRRGRSAFTLDALRLVLVVTAVLAGAHLAGAPGLAWALAASTTLFLVVTAVVARRMLTVAGR